MSKEFSFPNSGTCSKQTNFVLNDDHTIAFHGGHWRLQRQPERHLPAGTPALKAEDVIARLDGTLCGFRNTSCPDQIAQNLKKALEEMN